MDNKGYFLSLVVFPILAMLIAILFVEISETREFLANGIEIELKILDQLFERNAFEINNTTYWNYFQRSK